MQLLTPQDSQATAHCAQPYTEACSHSLSTSRPATGTADARSVLCSATTSTSAGAATASSASACGQSSRADNGTTAHGLDKPGLVVQPSRSFSDSSHASAEQAMPHTPVRDEERKGEGDDSCTTSVSCSRTTSADSTHYSGGPNGLAADSYQADLRADAQSSHSTVSSGSLQASVLHCSLCNLAIATEPDYWAHIQSPQHAEAVRIKAMAMPAAAESPEPASAEQPSPEQQHNQRANGVHAGFERNIGASADLAKQSGPASGSTGQALRPLSAVSPVRVTRHTMVREAVVAKGLAVEEGQSREVTQFHCDACDIFTTCQELLESHYRGRKHIKRMAALAAAEQGLGPMPETLPRQPQAETPFYCELCNVYATGEDQLAMHFEGKKHQRHVSLREVQQGGAVLLPRGTSAASSSSGGAAAPPKSLSGMELRCELCDIVAPSPQHFEFHIRGQKHLRKEKQRRQMAEQQLQEAEQAQLAGSPRAVPAEPLSQASDSAVEQEPNPFSNTAAEAPDAAVQPSLEQAAERAVGKEVGLAASAPAQPQLRRVLSGKPPLPPSRSSLELQGPRSSKSNVLSVSSASDAAGKGDDGAEASVSDSSAVPGLIPEEGAEASSSLESDAGLSRTLSSIPPLQASGGSVSIAGLHFCPVCGIIATSEANLQDHIGGRRHARRLQYISQQGNWGDGSRNSTSSGELQFTLTRQPSGNIYDNFPCVRVGDYNLPSSMDLRHYLEEVQEVGEDLSQPETAAAAAPLKLAGSAPTTGEPGGTASAASDTSDLESSFNVILSRQAGGAGSPEKLPARGQLAGRPGGDAGTEGPSGAAGSAPGSASASPQKPVPASPSPEGSDSHSNRTVLVSSRASTSLDIVASPANQRPGINSSEVLGTLRPHSRGAATSAHAGNQTGHGSEGFMCEVCKIATTSAAHLEVHFKGRKHLRRVAMLGSAGQAGRQGSGSSLEGSQSENSTPSSTPKAYASSASSHLTARDAFRCELCNVTATSQANLHAHFEGSLHKKRMQQQPSRTPSGSLGVPPPRPPAEPYPHHMLLHPQQRHHQQQALLQEHHEQQRMHGMGVGQSMHSVHSAAALYGSPSPHPMVHMGLASQSPPPLPSAVDMYMAHFYPPQYYHMAPHGQPGMAAYMAPTGWWGGAPPPQPGHVVGLPYRTPMQPFDANAMSMNAPLPHKRI